MNYTDVDDKTIAGAQKAGLPLREYTDQWIEAFRDDMAQLGLETPEEMPRATDEANLRAMSDLILALERNGHTYRRDGSIYFKISTLPQVRAAGAARSRRDEGRRARGRGRIHQGRPARFRAVEGDEAGRADVGLRHRAGPSRVAHRVLRDGAAPARRGADRHSCRRHRPDLPASRERDCAERGRHRTGSSRASGCTSSTCSSRTRRCRSRSATSTRCPTSSSAAIGRRRCAICCCRRTTASS